MMLHRSAWRKHQPSGSTVTQRKAFLASAGCRTGVATAAHFEAGKAVEACAQSFLRPRPIQLNIRGNFSKTTQEQPSAGQECHGMRLQNSKVDCTHSLDDSAQNASRKSVRAQHQHVEYMSAGKFSRWPLLHMWGTQKTIRRPSPQQKRSLSCSVDCSRPQEAFSRSR